MPKEDQTANPLMVDRRTLAALFDVSARAVTAWEAAGLPARRAGRGRPTMFDVGTAYRWIRDRQLAAAESAAGGVEQARARQLRASAAKLERQNQLADGQLLEKADVEATWSSFIMACRARFLLWPQMLAPRLVDAFKKHGLAGVVGQLEAELRLCLNELSGSDEPGVGEADDNQDQADQAEPLE